MGDKSTAPEASGIIITVDTVIDGTPAGSPVAIGHVDSVGSIVDKSRGVQKYTPMNDTQYDEIVSLGSLTQNAFNMGVLYDPEATEGINVLETAIDDNTEVQLILELNNKPNATGTGTLIKQICKVSNFKVDGAKDGKYMANFSAERIGDATVTAAAAGA